ncbi:hypothetical protein ES703_124049 [subsurface metagenome]
MYQRQQDTVSQFQGCFDRICEPDALALFVALDNQSVNDGSNVVFFIFVQERDIFDIVNFSVNTHTYKAFTLNVCEDFFMFTFFAADKRGTYLDFCAFRPAEQRLYYLGWMLACDFFSANPAVRLACTRKEQPEVVIDFCCRCNS